MELYLDKICRDDKRCKRKMILSKEMKIISIIQGLCENFFVSLLPRDREGALRRERRL